MTEPSSNNAFLSGNCHTFRVRIFLYIVNRQTVHTKKQITLTVKCINTVQCTVYTTLTVKYFSNIV